MSGLGFEWLAGEKCILVEYCREGSRALLRKDKMIHCSKGHYMNPNDIVLNIQ